MQTDDKKVKYPQNIYLRMEVFKDSRTQQMIADDIGYSRKVLNQTIHGKYKGENVIPILLKNLAAQKTKISENNSN